MSLINQMLRDLQEQKKSGGKTKPEPLRPKVSERIPYLPLPVVLGGAGLILLCLVWWLAGILSDMMFGFEPASKPAEQQIVAIENSTTAEDVRLLTEGNDRITMVETDQLTMAEREAEPPSVPVDPQLATEKESVSVRPQPVSIPPVKKTPVTKAVKSQPATVAAKAPVAKTTKRQPKPVPLREIKKLQPAQRPIQATKAVVKPSKRLHPDDLPGAVLTRNNPLIEAQVAVTRPSKSRATTPFGRAEEAYLDGKWALSQGRTGLAINSLQNALDHYPGHLPARELLADVLVKSGETIEAMSLLNIGLEIAPDYIVFKKKYARLLINQGDEDAAAKVLLKGGLPSVEEDPEAHVMLASLYQSLGEPFLAAQTYRNLLIAWPQTGAFWVGLGGALEGQKLPEEAIACYQRALKTKNLRKDLSQYAKKRLSVLN